MDMVIFEETSSLILMLCAQLMLLLLDLMVCLDMDAPDVLLYPAF